MKKSIKSVLAKSLAVVMAFSLAGIAPSTSSDAAAKKPTVTKKVSVKVGKTKTVKVTSKKKVKKTTWSLKKAGKKIVSLSKKKAKSVKVKGKKAGKATLTAKIKVGKKTYKKTCKITVTKAAVVTKKPTAKPTATATATATAPANGGNNGGNGGNSGSSTPTPRPTPAVPPASSLTVDGKTLTVDEASTYRLDLTELNETTFTSDSKRPIGSMVGESEVTEAHSDILYNRDGSVTFSSNATYNSGVSYYINPCTSEDQIVDLSDTRGEGFLGYNEGTKDMFAYDYIRVVLSSENEMNCRTYNGNDELQHSGFPGSCTSETYEGGWVGPTDDYMEAGNKEAGNTVKEDYVTRTVFVPIESLMAKGMNPETLTCVAFCPQSSGEEVTIYDIAFVKVNYDTKVTGIDVSADKTTLANGKVAKCTATVTPDDATRKIVKWTSSNEELATVNYKGQVVAAATGSGKVTITATSTDGSNVEGSVEITIGETGTDPTPVPDEYAPTIGADGSATLNLAADEIVASTNNGSATITDNITKDEDGIKYAGAYTMQMLDISAYLAKYNLDLSDYIGIEITGNLLDENGEVVECAAGKVKTALVNAAKLNGYDGSMLTTGQYKEFPTISLDLTGADAAALSEAAGFNFQIASTIGGDGADKDDPWSGFENYKTMLISSIKLIPAVDEDAPVVDETGAVSLALGADEIAASTNNGSATITDNITKDEDGIKYAGAYTMQMLDISAYLAKYELDLSDYAGIEIAGNLLDENGEVVECAAGKVKTALVNAAKLNGYDGSMLTTGQYKEFPTISLDLTGADAAALSEAAGFNFQIASTIGGDGADKDDPWSGFENYKTMLISSIKLIPPAVEVDEDAPVVDEATGNVTLALGADGIAASTNNGSATITDNITKDEDGIKYAGAYTMQMLDISAYLTKYELDLTDYEGIEITGNLLDENGEVVECAAGKVKTALVNAAKLNGYDGSMLTTGQYKEFPTISLDLRGADAAALSEAVGFNFQIASTIGGDGADKDDPWSGFENYKTMLISSIKLIKTME